MKTYEKYFLQHKNVKVAFITVGCDEIKTVKVNPDTERYLPVGVKNESELKAWLLRRCLPDNREFLKEDLGEKKKLRYMLEHLSMSMTDCYWLNPCGSNMSWSSVSPFRNKFKEPFVLNICPVVEEGNYTPNSTVGGSLRKKWIHEGGENPILVKGNHGEGSLQARSEVFATSVHEKQGFENYVEYWLCDIPCDGESVVASICASFTSEQYEFVPAYDFLMSLGKKPNCQSYYQFFVSGCKHVGVDVVPFLDYMFMTDFIISNYDRHLNNFGLLRDTETLEYIGCAPIFDSGDSFFGRLEGVPSGKALLNLNCNSFYSKELNMLKVVKNSSLVDVSKLPEASTLDYLLSHDGTISDDKRSRICSAYTEKIEYFEVFQKNPAKFFDYKYRK